MAHEINALLDKVRSVNENDDKFSKVSQSAREYISIIHAIDELTKLKKDIYSKLSDYERSSVVKYMISDLKIPDYISVRDAADILGVSPQMVRRYCADGTLQAFQRFENKGNWLIKLSQFKDRPNFEEYEEYIERKRKRIKENNKKMAELMIKWLDEEE